MASMEIDNRSALRDLIAGLASWEDWTGLAVLADRKARVGWPEAVETVWPFIVVFFGGGGRINLTGGDSSANFRSRGMMRVVVFDKASDPDDLMTSDTAFGTRFFGLIDEIVENAHTGPMMIRGLQYGDNPYVVSGLNTANAVDANADDEDDESALETLFYTGVFDIDLGVA